MMGTLLKNSGVAAFVFLPMFLVVSVFENLARGLALFDETISYHAGAALVIYISMLLPVLLGSIVHSIVLFLIETRGIATGHPRLIATLAAPILPLAVVVLDLSGGMMLTSFAFSTAIATLAYGVCTAAPRFGRTNSRSAVDGR